MAVTAMHIKSINILRTGIITSMSTIMSTVNWVSSCG